HHACICGELQKRPPMGRPQLSKIGLRLEANLSGESRKATRVEVALPIAGAGSVQLVIKQEPIGTDRVVIVAGVNVRYSQFRQQTPELNWPSEQVMDVDTRNCKQIDPVPNEVENF